MHARCSKPTFHRYDRYGGRGIKVCDRWKVFANFLADVGRKPSPSHTLERLNNDGDYEPSNVAWVTRKIQARNRRSNRLITAHGETLTLAEWAERIGVDRETISKRLKRGVLPEIAVSQPAARLRRRGTIG